MNFRDRVTIFWQESGLETKFIYYYYYFMFFWWGGWWWCVRGRGVLDGFVDYDWKLQLWIRNDTKITTFR